MFASAIGWLSHHAALVVLINLSLGFAGVPALTEGALLTAGAAIVLSFFTPGLRHVTALALGASRLARRRFVTFAVGGACAWASTLILGGYMAGDAAGRVSASSRSLLSTTVTRALRDRSHVLASPRKTHEVRRLRGDTQLPDFVTI